MRLVGQAPEKITTVAPGEHLIDFGRVAFGNLRLFPPAGAKGAIKASTFADISVDGDCERIPYEADAYLNQPSHYATDTGVQMARNTYDHLMKHPTWPTEWAFHMIFMAHADWMHTGGAAWVANRGMACSVYAARYLLAGLFTSDSGEKAHALITAANDRSWKHMVESGTTITWEAWDQRYKPNQDWNQAWGAAPANLFPRIVLGAQVLIPG